MSDPVAVEVERRVARCTIADPERRNALGPELAEILIGTLERLDADDEVRVVVLAGTGDFFATGPDIRSYSGSGRGPASDTAMAGFWERHRALAKPSVAAVAGWALSTGCELALACDLMVVAKDAVFGMPEITFGLIPSGGATQRLTRALGRARAMELILTGRRMTGGQAFDWGLANIVMDRRDVLDQAVMLAEEVAARPPLALRYAKQAVLAADDLGLTAGLERERELFGAALATEDRVEGIEALLEGRKPDFRGR
ncbi:MAG: enoyl-CoA hydratase-related protein [Solirubrobacterales bacterium]|nr:enoyl-CoA hydratase/isomerase family protein [Solirubrobacterales bacterium]